MFEWVTKLNISAGFLSVGWENVLVGNLCWFFIFILIRLTVFLQTQRYKLKLMTLAMAIFLLSMNVEEFGSIGQTSSLHQANLQMVVKTNFSIPKHDHEGNMEKILSSVQPDKQLTALQMVLAPDLLNQLQEINHHGINYWTNSNPQTPKSNQQCNMAQTFPSVQYSRKLSAQQMALVPAIFNLPQATNNLGRYL